MSLFNQTALKIIKEQELVIGPLAWDEAKKVEGLKIIDKKNGQLEIISNDPKSVIDRLVSRYEKIFGEASNDISQAAANITHVYFYAAPTTEVDLKESYALINNTLTQTDLFITSNYKPDEVQGSTEATAPPQLDQTDAFIIEGTANDPEIGFLLAHAIALKKPVLYLYRHGTVPKIFSRLSRHELPGFVKVAAYENDKLNAAILAFLKSIEGIVIREIPHIKFTLRITNSIEKYLHYKTHNTKLRKADYLRELIEKTMEQDKNWEEYQRKQQQ